MRFPWTAILVLILTTMATSGMNAQVKYPPETRNAALRYWLAFAEMKDAPADQPTQELLEKTADSRAVWDEAKLAPVLDANNDAIQIMQRATKLPNCDWGIEYSQGSKASIAYAPRARALARLNTLAGMREMAKGNSQAAMNTWLGGIHFSQDLARGGSLIFALIARAAMLPNLQALAEASRNGQWNETQKKEVLATVRALPEDGLDWGSAWRIESATGEEFLEGLRTAANPGATYEAIMGEPAPKQDFPPTAQEIQLYREYMQAVQASLRESPVKAKAMLDALATKKSRLSEIEENLIPNPQKSNDARLEVRSAREDLLKALAAK